MMIPNNKHTNIAKGTLSVMFIISISGNETKASKDPIEISTSPAINNTAKPMEAIRVIDSCPETFMTFLTLKKYSEAKEKKTKTNKKIINKANSPFFKYLIILFIIN